MILADKISASWSRFLDTYPILFLIACFSDVIFFPFPNVAEDHHTKNAFALVNYDAALYVIDIEAPDTLLNTALKTVNDEAKLASLSENIKKLGLKNSADVIADEVIKLATGK